MTGQPAANSDGADRLGADRPGAAAPPDRRGWRHGAWSLLRHAGLYLALLVGAAVVLGGASALAHELGFDVNDSRFARLFMLGIYVLGAVAMMRRVGR